MILNRRKGSLAAAVLVCAALAGCRSGNLPSAAQPSPAPVSCGAEIAGQEQLTAPLVLVGEIHGTSEIPAAFGRLVCRAAAGRPGETVLAGLEVLSTSQAAIDAFLASDGGAAAAQALLAQEFWAREYQDGRSSKAMLTLLDEIRRLRKAGLKIEVLALDVEHYDSPSARDAAMAASLVEAIETVRPAQTLVLVGNVHSRTLNGYPWDAKAAYVPLGALLRARYENLIALDVKNSGGSAWICTSADAKDCGARDQLAREMPGPLPRIDMDPAAAPRTGHDGALFIGPVTASPPAYLERP